MREGVLLSDIACALSINLKQTKSYIALVATEGRDSWTSEEGHVVYRPEVADVLGQLGRGETTITGARAKLAGLEPLPPRLPEPAPLPFIDDEIVKVVSVPRRMPNGMISHFTNPFVIQCQRASAEYVFVQVHTSRMFGPFQADGTPTRIHVCFKGTPRFWEFLRYAAPIGAPATTICAVPPTTP